jgi:hypothetical protein
MGGNTAPAYGGSRSNVGMTLATAILPLGLAGIS